MHFVGPHAPAQLNVYMREGVGSGGGCRGREREKEGGERDGLVRVCLCSSAQSIKGSLPMQASMGYLALKVMHLPGIRLKRRVLGVVWECVPCVQRTRSMLALGRAAAQCLVTPLTLV